MDVGRTSSVRMEVLGPGDNENDIEGGGQARKTEDPRLYLPVQCQSVAFLGHPQHLPFRDKGQLVSLTTRSCLVLFKAIEITHILSSTYPLHSTCPMVQLKEEEKENSTSSSWRSAR